MADIAIHTNKTYAWSDKENPNTTDARFQQANHKSLTRWHTVMVNDDSVIVFVDNLTVREAYEYVGVRRAALDEMFAWNEERDFEASRRSEEDE